MWCASTGRWRPGAARQRFSFEVPAAEAGVAQRLAFVVVDAATQRPVQALALDC